MMLLLYLALLLLACGGSSRAPVRLSRGGLAIDKSTIPAVLAANRPLLQKFNSTIAQLAYVSAYDLQFAAGKSFATRDYYRDIIDNALSTKESDDASKSFIALSAVSIISSAIVIPQIPVDVLPLGGVRNFFSFATLILPFLLISISLVNPDFMTTLNRVVFNRNNMDSSDKSRRRILCHESGHFLLGHLCGLPVTDYLINGDRQSATVIDFGGLNTKEAIADIAGNLLITALGGCVAETLVMGDSRGGREDIPVVYEILRVADVAAGEKEAAVRWALLKALQLLRIHREALDDLVDAFDKGLDVISCIEIIENSRD